MLGNVGSLCRRSLPKEPFYVETLFCDCFLFREKILHQPMFRYAPELKRIGDRKWCTFLHPKTQQGLFRLWRACAREITKHHLDIMVGVLIVRTFNSMPMVNSVRGFLIPKRRST